MITEQLKALNDKLTTEITNDVAPINFVLNDPVNTNTTLYDDIIYKKMFIISSLPNDTTASVGMGLNIGYLLKFDVTYRNKINGIFVDANYFKVAHGIDIYHYTNGTNFYTVTTGDLSDYFAVVILEYTIDTEDE